MKTGRAMAAAVAVIGSVLVAGPAAQAAEPKLTVTSVTLGRSTVVVSGLNTVAVPVRVKGGYDSTDPQHAYTSLVVYLSRTSGTHQLTTMIATPLERVAGTVQNGEWLGTLNVPSTANGTFKVVTVQVGPYKVDPPRPAPVAFDGPTLTVAGSHLPRLTALVIPRVVPFGSGFTVRAAVTDSATGKPYGTKVLVAFASAGWCRYDTFEVRTDTAGIAQTSYPGGLADVPNCIRLRNGEFDKLSLTLLVARPGILTATPAVASARVGTVVDVNGSVLGKPVACPVALQRLYGATRWRGVSQGAVRASGRFTVKAQPPYVGNVTYRAYLPTCGRYQAGYSRTFVIRGS
jgi:hypothetical protein